MQIFDKYTQVTYYVYSLYPVDSAIRVVIFINVADVMGHMIMSTWQIFHIAFILHTCILTKHTTRILMKLNCQGVNNESHGCGQQIQLLLKCSTCSIGT